MRKRTLAAAIIWFTVNTGVVFGQFNAAGGWPSTNYPYLGATQAQAFCHATWERARAVGKEDTDTWTTQFPSFWAGLGITPNVGSLKRGGSLHASCTYLKYEAFIEAKTLLKEIVPFYVQAHLASDSSAPTLTNFASRLNADGTIPLWTNVAAFLTHCGIATNYLDVTMPYELNVGSTGWRYAPVIFSNLVATLGNDMWYQSESRTNTDADTLFSAEAHSTNAIWTNTLAEITPPWDHIAWYEDPSSCPWGGYPSSVSRTVPVISSAYLPHDDAAPAYAASWSAHPEVSASALYALDGCLPLDIDGLWQYVTNVWTILASEGATNLTDYLLEWEIRSKCKDDWIATAVPFSHKTDWYLHTPVKITWDALSVDANKWFLFEQSAEGADDLISSSAFSFVSTMASVEMSLSASCTDTISTNGCMAEEVYTNACTEGVQTCEEISVTNTIHTWFTFVCQEDTNLDTTEWVLLAGCDTLPEEEFLSGSVVTLYKNVCDPAFDTNQYRTVVTNVGTTATYGSCTYTNWNPFPPCYLSEPEWTINYELIGISEQITWSNNACYDYVETNNLPGISSVTYAQDIRYPPGHDNVSAEAQKNSVRWWNVEDGFDYVGQE